MNKRLLPYKNFNADIFVGDYTEYAKLHPEYVNVGVIFNDKPFHNLRALHIINRNKITVGVVNFEKCQSLFKNENGELVKQCEGLCFAVNAKKHGWVLLIEMKYCKGKNIGKNVDAAISQLEKSLEYLRNTKKIIESKDRVYWVVAIPEHDELEPFSSFVFSQNDLLDLQERLNVVMFFRQNKLEVRTNSHLGIPKA